MTWHNKLNVKVADLSIKTSIHLYVCDNPLIHVIHSMRGQKDLLVEKYIREATTITKSQVPTTNESGKKGVHLIRYLWQKGTRIILLLILDRPP